LCKTWRRKGRYSDLLVGLKTGGPAPQLLEKYWVQQMDMSKDGLIEISSPVARCYRLCLYI
jgi:hypothetical protein